MQIKIPILHFEMVMIFFRAVSIFTGLCIQRNKQQIKRRMD